MRLPEHVELFRSLEALAQRHTAPDVRAGLSRAELERIAFHMELVALKAPDSRTIGDIGGGIGLFSLGCALFGMDLWLVDDFADPVDDWSGPSALDLHRSLGIRVTQKDFVGDVLALAGSNLDVVTSFDSLEHCRHSQRRALRKAMDSLRSGGLFLLGTPNRVNLRKRITVPFGYGKWSGMSKWYHQDVLRGHVRESDVEDLLHFAGGLGLEHPEILGKNWQGLLSGDPSIRVMARLIDQLLRPVPSLCMDAYVLGHKSLAPLLPQCPA